MFCCGRHCRRRWFHAMARHLVHQIWPGRARPPTCVWVRFRSLQDSVTARPSQRNVCGPLWTCAAWGGGRSQTTFKRRCVFHIHTHAQTHKHANLHTRTKTNQLPNSNTGPDDSTGPDDTTGQTPKVRDHTPRMSQPKLRDPAPTTVFWISPGPHPPVTNRHLAIRDPSSMYRARVTRPTPRRSHTRTPVVAQCTLHPYHGNREPIEPRMEPNSSSRRTQERTPGPGEIKEPGLSLTCLLPARTVVITKRDARYHRNVY